MPQQPDPKARALAALARLEQKHAAGGSLVDRWRESEDLQKASRAIERGLSGRTHFRTDTTALLPPACSAPPPV